MTPTKTMTPIQRAHLARVEQGNRTKKAIVDSLRSATQPVTVGEIQQYLKKKRDVKLHSTHIRHVLVAATTEGLVFSREETPTEQETRGSRATRASILFWAGGKNVPARTKKEVYGGIVSKPLPDMPKNIKKIKKTKVRPGGTSEAQTGQVNYLVQSKNFELAKSDSFEIFSLKLRISELEAQLSAVRKLLS